MPIYRIHADRFTIIDNEILESRELSWKAKGLLGYMLGRPDGWEFSERALYGEFPDGQTSTRSGLKELEEGRYLFREKVREDGKIVGCVWHVSQTPRDWQSVIHDLKTSSRVSQTGESTNNKKLIEEKTEEEITESLSEVPRPAKTSTRFVPPTPAEVAEYARSIGKTIDADSFCDFYSSKGWKVGSSSMKDWKAAVRNWCRRNEPKQPKQTAFAAYDF